MCPSSSGRVCVEQLVETFRTPSPNFSHLAPHPRTSGEHGAASAFAVTACDTLRTALYIDPLIAALPGAMIFFTSLCLNLLSDGLRSAMNVKD